tara:strand:+ start:293 stop:502 length:210 start_codon:yes stop_codon:yes gene_type:complete
MKVQVISFHNGGQVLDVDGVDTVADVAQKLELSMENVVISVNDASATAGTQLTNGAVVQFQKQSVKSGL